MVTLTLSIAKGKRNPSAVRVNELMYCNTGAMKYRRPTALLSD